MIIATETVEMGVLFRGGGGPVRSNLGDWKRGVKRRFVVVGFGTVGAEAGAPSSALRAPSPRGEKGRCGTRLISPSPLGMRWAAGTPLETKKPRAMREAFILRKQFSSDELAQAWYRGHHLVDDLVAGILLGDGDGFLGERGDLAHAEAFAH